MTLRLIGVLRVYRLKLSGSSFLCLRISSSLRAGVGQDIVAASNSHFVMIAFMTAPMRSGICGTFCSLVTVESSIGLGANQMFAMRLFCQVHCVSVSVARVAIKRANNI